MIVKSITATAGPRVSNCIPIACYAYGTNQCPQPSTNEGTLRRSLKPFLGVPGSAHRQSEGQCSAKDSAPSRIYSAETTSMKDEINLDNTAPVININRKTPKSFFTSIKPLRDLKDQRQALQPRPQYCRSGWTISIVR